MARYTLADGWKKEIALQLKNIGLIDQLYGQDCSEYQSRRYCRCRTNGANQVAAKFLC